MSISTEWTELHVADGSQMMAYVARPDHPKTPAPGMLVIQEAFGITGHIKDVVHRMAESGYVAVAPEMFHRTAPHGFAGDYEDFSTVAPHTSALTPETVEADLRSAFEFLCADNAVDPKRIGSIGFCMGGRCSFIANALLPLRAAASFYGGGIVPKFLPLAKEQHGAILLAWGGQDKHLTPDVRRSLTDALTEANKNFISIEFSKADHGFLCTDRAAYNPEAAAEAWPLLLAFFERQFASEE